MPTVTREIHIDAAPDAVRRLVADPAGRERWLDDPAADPTPDGDGGHTYTRTARDAPPSHVRIEVLPDGDGTRVRVTERRLDTGRGDTERGDTERRGHPDVADGPRAHLVLVPPLDEAPDDPGRDEGRDRNERLVPDHDLHDDRQVAWDPEHHPWLVVTAA
jgi:hypothetical protein